MHDDTLRFGSATELWYELVRDGEQRMHTPLPESIESYLVFVLLRHQRDAAMGGRIMALEWLDSVERVGSERADSLRDVGDRCLLIAGMFPRLAERRQVRPSYYAALGRGAYEAVAASSRAGYAELFEQLARAFDAMLRVLAGLHPRQAPASANVQSIEHELEALMRLTPGLSRH